MLSTVRSMSELCRLSLNSSGFDAGDKDRKTDEQDANSGIDDEIVHLMLLSLYSVDLISICVAFWRIRRGLLDKFRTIPANKKIQFDKNAVGLTCSNASCPSQTLAKSMMELS